MADIPEKLEQTIRAHTEKFLEQTIEKLRTGPGSPEFPMTIMFLTSAHGENSSLLTTLFPCETIVPGKPDGWAQALFLSRDLLRILVKLDADFGLSMSALPALLASHPLFADVTVEALTPTSGDHKIH